MRIVIAILGFIFLMGALHAQQLPVPDDIGSGHPRCFGKEMSLEAVKTLVGEEEWAAKIIEKTRQKLKPYLVHYKNDPTWLVSRLQMYWKTRHNQVYINGGHYSHAEGEAPAPTVKFIGGRGTKTYHKRPGLEDILPYMDDPRGLYLERNDGQGQWEWVPISGTGGIVASINREILGLARDAAFLNWYTGEEVYAKLAYDILDTYLTGIYYLKEPIDLSHGHHQTLVAYTQFEVIQEHYIAEVTQTYDFLHSYISNRYPEKVKLFSATLQKWADQVIKNGVSFNNWNLFQASHVSRIALVLEDDSAYENGKGAQYYLDRIMNRTSTRQWSMTKLINYGYDPETGIWNESPGYALGVLRDFIHFAEFYDRTFDIDLIAELPVLRQAVISSAQYLYPNGYRVAFGDGHYGKLDPGPVLYMIENAQKYGKKEDEVYFIRMLKTLFDEDVYSGKFKGKSLADLFAREPLQVREDIHAGTLADFTSPLFYAPNTSWLVQRQGQGNTGLMISQIGSLGNHMHSNGIAMELYGYGLPLAPEMGHGSSYFSIEYAEYYTQFPAHNTVIVNGKSKYPEMKSNHAFELVAAYPMSNQSAGNFPGLTFSDLEFLEPETYSTQRRVMGIIQIGGDSGYYIDIFRSKQIEGKDIKHEYFYHNLGQSLTLTDWLGNELALQPTTRLAFGDGDLMAYDYMWNKRSVITDQDFRGQFCLEMEDKTVSMNLWMKGEEDREIFSVLSPKSTAFRHGPLPEELNDLPVPTLVVGQKGEAWDRPFVAVYEPALNGHTNIRSVDFFGEAPLTGIHVLGKLGKEDFIFSSTEPEKWQHQDITLDGTYGVVSTFGDDFSLFVGNGRSVAFRGYQLSSDSMSAKGFESKNGQWYVMTEGPACLSVSIDEVKSKYILKTADGKTYPGTVDKKAKRVCFDLPGLDYTEVEMVIEE